MNLYGWLRLCLKIDQDPTDLYGGLNLTSYRAT